MENSQIDDLLRLMKSLPNREEQVEGVEQWWRDASQESRDKIEKTLYGLTCREKERERIDREPKRVILKWKVEEYEKAPLAKKSGQPSMYYVWDAYVYATENNLEVPEIIKDRVNQYVMSIARKALAKKKGTENESSTLAPHEEIEWRDRYIAGCMHELRKTLPGESIEDLSFQLQDRFEEEYQEDIRDLTKWYQLNNKTWPKTKAQLAATELADNTHGYKIDLEANTIARIYIRIKKEQQ